MRKPGIVAPEARVIQPAVGLALGFDGAREELGFGTLELLPNACFSTDQMDLIGQGAVDGPPPHAVTTHRKHSAPQSVFKF